MKLLAAPHAIALAHVTRALEFAKALRKRGHEVIFACGERYRRILEHERFECRDVLTESPEKALVRVREGRRFADDDQVLAAYVQDECRVIREVRPDAVLGDLRPTLGISTELLQLPYITIIHGCLTKYYAAPHPPPETIPITRWLGRRAAAWIVPRLQRLALRRMAAPFRRYRREHGLDGVASMLDVLESPVLNLIADVPEFAPTRHLPGHFRYVGPLTWNPPLGPPPWLKRLPERKRKVYVTLGSTGRGRGAIEAILRALGSMDLEVMVVGDCVSVDPGALARFHWAPLAPGGLLARHADLVICHGGNGTIYQALSAGRPVLCLPTFVEQEYHADRVVALGAGMKLTPNRVSSRAVRAACEELLDDPRYRAAASRSAAKIRGWDGPEIAAYMIELVVGGHGPGRPSRPAPSTARAREFAHE